MHSIYIPLQYAQLSYSLTRLFSQDCSVAVVVHDNPCSIRDTDCRAYTIGFLETRQNDLSSY